MTALAALRRFWPAIPILLLALWAIRLDGLRAGYRADLAAERSARAIDAANDRAAVATAEAGFARAQAAATTSYADRLATREPIILRSIDTVTRYANTDAGRARCLAADGVRRFQDGRDALFADDPTAARGVARAVSPRPDHDPG